MFVKSINTSHLQHRRNTLTASTFLHTTKQVYCLPNIAAYNIKLLVPTEALLHKITTMHKE